MLFIIIIIIIIIVIIIIIFNPNYLFILNASSINRHSDNGIIIILSLIMVFLII